MENRLTEREEKYFNYYMNNQQERPLKMLISVLLISGEFLLFFILLCLYHSYSANALSEDVLSVLSVLALFGIVSVLCFFAVYLLKKRLKRYEILRLNICEVNRTKILEKNVLCGRNTKVYYYTCPEINVQVAPVSKKLYDVAKVGDDITAVMVKYENMMMVVGITFDEKFERDYL